MGGNVKVGTVFGGREVAMLLNMHNHISKLTTELGLVTVKTRPPHKH